MDERLRAILRALREAGTGGAENVMALATGMAAQPVGGLNMLGSMAMGKGFDRSVQAGQGVAEALTYAPRTDIGQRGQQNIGEAMGAAGEAISKYGGFDALGEKSPALGALALGVANVAGPPGKPKAPKLSGLLRDPGSPQALIPGLKPHSQETVAQLARDQYARALRDANFSTERADYAFSPTERTYAVEPNPTRVDRSSDYEMTPGHPEEMARQQARGSTAEYQRAMAKADAVRDAEAQVAATRRPLTAARAQTQQGVIDALRARRAPSLGPRESFELERSIGLEKRDQPVIGETTDYSAGNSGYYTPDDPIGASAALVHELPEADRPALVAHRDRARQQNMLRQDAEDYLTQTEAEAAKGPPEVPQPPWVANLLRTPSEGAQPPADRRWWNKALNVRSAEPHTGDPNLMNPATVEAFLEGARDNPAAFMYGTREAHKGARSLEDMARSFGRESGQRISVERRGGGYDDDWSPPMMEHGRGEVMRDRYGDYKGADRTHEPGDYPMYDESGEVRKIEAPGPTYTGEPLRIKKKAEGGETKYDEYGDTEFEYKKSRGGEPMRDERGNIKYDEDAEPPYDSGSGEEIELKVPGKGGLEVSGYDSGDDIGVNAMGGGKGSGAGELLYQVLYSDALRSGQTVGGRSLTDINKLRQLANTLSNYARWGDNPRDVGGTRTQNMTTEMREALNNTAGTKGPDIWRAETAEVKGRLGSQANRVTFDGESFFIDGEPATPKDMQSRIKELSPDISSTGVGQKSIMRTALFDWLRTASPEDATALGKNWQTIGSPIFGRATPEMLGALAATSAGGLTLASLLRNKDQSQ